MFPGDAAAEHQLLDRSRPPDHSDAGPARSWDEQVPPPGRDATLLAVVPIPGTGTSLAIVGYAITTSAADPAGPAPPSPGTQSSPGDQPSPGRGLLLDHVQRRVWIDEREVQLTFQEFELLAFLAAHPATVFTRAELVERVWHRTLGQDGRPVPHTADLLARLFDEELEHILERSADAGAGDREVYRRARKETEDMILSGRHDPV